MNSQNIFKEHFNYGNYSIHHYQELKSSNDLAKELLENQQIFANEIILSDIQTQGKGRLNRQWQSPIGNLYFSLIIDLSQVDKSFYSSFPLMCSIVVNEVLSDLGQDKFKVLNKWPNDLLIENKKVCGILVENLLNNYNQQLAIIGIGVNINSNPSSTRYPATNLKEYAINTNNINLLKKFLDKFNIFFEIWKRFGFKNLKKTWLEKAYLLNQELTINIAKDCEENLLTGIFKNIDEFGNIILSKDQQTFTISVGDVS